MHQIEAHGYYDVLDCAVRSITRLAYQLICQQCPGNDIQPS